MFGRHESISVNTFTLVNPEFDKVVGFLDSLDLGGEKTLENVGQMTHVELVMEVSSGLSELGRHISVEGKSRFDHGYHLLGDSSLELGEMLEHEGGVDGVKGVGLREVNGKEPEPTLESGVDDEGSSSGVHSSDVLGVKDFLHVKLLFIVPTGVIKGLTDQRNGSLGFIRIQLGHVQIIHEVDELTLGRSNTSSSLLLKLGLQDLL
jgi:hypothetical protein